VSLDVWNPDPFIVVPLVVLVYAYWGGTKKLWRAAGHGRGIRPWQTLAFASAILAIVAALLSPLDILADRLFSAHMGQHLLLMTVAAPLLALATPEVAVLWALRPPHRTALGSALRRLRAVRILGALPIAFALHSAALWLWHAPPLYEAALHNAVLHALEHATLLGTGYMFWSAAFSGLRRAGRGLLVSFLYVFVLGAQCTGLGALITLSSRPWYPSYGSLDDQVLAGVLMWVPAGFAYLAYALWLLGAWLRQIGRASCRERV